MRIVTAALALLATATATTATASDPGASQRHPPAAEVSPIPRATGQLMLVRTAGWTAVTGTLRRFTHAAGGKWEPVGEPVVVNVGRRGMAWGRGLHGTPLEAGISKKEGDGKAPAGAFSLGPAFGYPEVPPEGSKQFPYLRMSGRTCVEDPRSKFYNQVVEAPGFEKINWSGRAGAPGQDPRFRWGVIVQHNAPEPLPGAGSCIFLHVWLSLGTGTSGCTSMAPERIEEVIRWLDPAEKPVLVQLPDPEYARLREAWALP